ncbi:MAG: type II secretion system protein [Patescibacteria group bacterium]
MYKAAQNKLLKTKGFTLIELLLVIVIISVLSGLILAVLNSSGIRSKGRDTQRISDLQKIQTALEIYFAENLRYPTTGSAWRQVNDNNSNFMKTALSPAYLSHIPEDPSGETGGTNSPCNNANFNRYAYYSPASAQGRYYILTAILENPKAASDLEMRCEQLSNWNLSGCGNNFPTKNYCVGVKQPES